MGMGVAGIVDWLGRRSVSPSLVVVAALAALAIPGGMLFRNVSTHDRTGDTLARDYAYNLLETCDQDSILFTNGDNDTFPICCAQEVYGIRPDVTAVNLALSNATWYMQQIRDYSMSSWIALYVIKQQHGAQRRASRCLGDSPDFEMMVCAVNPS